LVLAFVSSRSSCLCLSVLSALLSWYLVTSGQPTANGFHSGIRPSNEPQVDHKLSMEDSVSSSVCFGRSVRLSLFVCFGSSVCLYVCLSVCLGLYVHLSCLSIYPLPLPPSPSQLQTPSTIDVSLSTCLTLWFLTSSYRFLVKHPWISWFPRLNFCGRCRNLEFTASHRLFALSVYRSSSLLRLHYHSVSSTIPE